MAIGSPASTGSVPMRTVRVGMAGRGGEGLGVGIGAAQAIS